MKPASLLIARPRRSDPRIAGTQSQWLPTALWTATVALSLISLSPATSHLNVFFDLLANLSYFSGLPLLIIAIVAAFIRQRALAAFATAGIITTMSWVIARIDWPEAQGDAPDEISLLFSNIEGQPAAWPRLRKLVDQLQPDLITIVEAEPAVIQEITSDRILMEKYPFQILPQPGWRWSQAVLSRHHMAALGLPGNDPRYTFLFSFHRAAVVSLPQGKILLTLEHPSSPRSSKAWQSGNEKIRLLGEVCRNQFAATGFPILVAGDFNTSPTGYRIRLLREVTGLHGDPSAGFLYGSWPSYLPAPFRIPLGRLWGSDEIAFTSRRVLAAIGSDHRPILVTFHQKSSPRPEGLGD